MQHLPVKTCVAVACALGLLAFTQPAKAVSPLALEKAEPLVIHVQDMEDEAVESDLESDIYPPGSQDEMSEPMKEPKEEKKSEGMEEEMVDE